MDDDNSTVTEDDVPTPNNIGFIILLIVEIFSILCTSVILAFLLRNWKSMIKKTVRNHVILLLNIATFLNLTIDLPFTISYYKTGYNYPRGLSFCLWWYWIDYTLLIISTYLTAAASVQRHILVFKAHWLKIRRKRWLLHFIPIIICLIYPALFYLSVIVFYPCDYVNQDNSVYCYTPCYTDNIVLFNVDWICNTACPLFAIILANIILVIRVIHSFRKTRRQQVLIQKRQRKLTLQLLALSSLYVIGWVPSTVISILISLALPNLLTDIPQLNYFNYITYLVCPLQPFLCILSLPELIKLMKKYFTRFFQRAKVVPLETVRAIT